MLTDNDSIKQHKDLSRVSARELVFQAMYASDSGGSSSSDTLTRFFVDRGFVGENTKFARRLIEGVGKNQSAIDLSGRMPRTKKCDSGPRHFKLQFQGPRRQSTENASASAPASASAFASVPASALLSLRQ